MESDKYDIIYDGEFYYDRNTSTHLWGFKEERTRYDLWKSRLGSLYLVKTLIYYDADRDYYYDGDATIYSVNDKFMLGILKSNSAPFNVIKDFADMIGEHLEEK